MIGDNIKRIRELKDLGVNELARIANMNASYISALERNKKNNPSMDVLEKLATALQVSVLDILKTPENSYSIELLTVIQNAYSEKDNYSTRNEILLDFLSSELNIESDELFDVYNNKSTDLSHETQSILLNHLKTLNPNMYTDFTQQDIATVNEQESIYGIDEDIKAIIEALKNASPNKKAKVLKMIELFEDEK